MGAAVQFYMSGKAKKLKTVPELIKKETLNAVRRGTRFVRNEVHGEYIKRGIGRALYEGRGTRILGGSSLATIIKQGRTKYSKDGETIETSVYAKGTAALVQQGGSTKPHEIKPSLDKFRTSTKKRQYELIAFKQYQGRNAYGDLKGVLSNFKGKGGFLARGTVKHPGSRFKRDDFLGRGSARGGPKFQAEVAKGMANVAAVVNGG